ncbi:TPR-like protein [Rhizophagus irregularis]|uniref:TPR-like protein n=1 Tax=Rhizophagus irregularis TaxID=588596 RepID=A0A2N0RPZ5_9GLOM|nr:TPR-like protein [Rhizophagus irregularis]
MERNSIQSESSLFNNFENNEFASNNSILLELEEDGYITPNEKVEVLTKDLTKLKYLFALKLLFENPLNQFLPEVLRNSLISFADPTSFDYYEKRSVARLELHMYLGGSIGKNLCYANAFNLRDDETWFQEIVRRTKDLLKAALNITPGVLSMATGVTLPNDNCSTLSMLTQLHKGLNFKYPSYLEKEWNDVADNSILDSQSKFDEVSNKLVKILRNTGSFINDLAGNEPLALPHTLWFGILDLAQNLIQKSTQKSTHGLCYYLAIESLNRAPSSFIQFKAIEILFHLYKFNNQMFSIIEVDFGQYIQKLNENNSTIGSSEKFQNLLTFVKNKCYDDFNLLYNDNLRGKGKEKVKEKGKGNQSIISTNKQISESINILKIVANEMTCPIDHEPTDQLCILKCQHIISFNNLKRLKQKKCPKCRVNIEDNEIKYLSQNTIYKILYPQFFEAGHIIEIDDSTYKQYNSDSGDSEVDLMLTKKKKILKANMSLKSIFQIRNTKKQHSILYQSAIKELDVRNYKNAEHWCKEFLKTFPASYSMKCILAYTYRCLNDYKQAHLYLNEAIKLKGKKSIVWYIRGEIHFRKCNYYDAIRDLKSSINYKAKINNIYMVLGISYHNINNNKVALKNFDIVLQNDSTNYLCLKYCAYIYEKQGRYLDTLKMLDKLLSINEKDSLILCYYGEILSKIEEYDNAIIWFTKVDSIDPENVHNLTKRAVTYYILQEYDNALLNFNNIIQMDTSNILAYYCKGLIYYMMEDINNSMIAFKKCIELYPNNDLEKMYLKDSRDYLSQISKVDYDLKWLTNYHKLITKINRSTNIYHDKSLLFMRCKIYIELKNYYEAKLDLNRLFELNDDISFVYLLKKYSDFWSYLCEDYFSDFVELGYNDKFNIYMFKVWKINVKKIYSPDVFIKFIIERNIYEKKEYILKYEDILELEGLGWIEYMSFFSIYLYGSKWIQFSIETKKDSIDMQIDYVRFTKSTEGNNHENRIYFPKMDHLLPFHMNNVPEAFEDKYFIRKETENLLELNDIISNL